MNRTRSSGELADESAVTRLTAHWAPASYIPVGPEPLRYEIEQLMTGVVGATPDERNKARLAAVTAWIQKHYPGDTALLNKILDVLDSMTGWEYA